MSITKRLRYILILVVLAAGAMFPLFWLGLLVVLFDRANWHKQPIKSEGSSPREPTYSEAYIDSLDICQPDYKPTPQQEAVIHAWSRVDKRSYLTSPEWDILRKAILLRDLYRCQSCGATGVPLDVHHLTYVRLGEEKHSDLTSLCRSCHDRQHQHYGYDYSTDFSTII